MSSADDTREARLLVAFEKVHGKLGGACRAEVVYSDCGQAIAVACMKGGEAAWKVSIEELTFDLVTLGANHD